MKILIITKSENPPGASLWQIEKSIIHSIQKFKKMKKLIFLAMMLAILAGTNNVFGQCAVHKSGPIPVACTTDPLHPMAGTPYNYSVTVNPTGGNFQWWATADQNFIAAGANNIGTRYTVLAGELVATSASYGVTSTTDNVDITWASSTLSSPNPIFVAVQYDAPAGGCANNLKVYQVQPVNAFTVDIKNLQWNYDTTAYGTLLDTCVSPIKSATYQAPGVTYDFGDNALLYEVVLANFSVSATVSFSIAGLNAGQSVDLSWGCTPATANANSLGLGLGNGLVALTANATTLETNTHVGVSIYVLAVVHNNNYEGLVNTDIALSVNAVNAEGLADVVNSDCSLTQNFEDTSTQRILPRPTVTNGTTGGTFLIIN
jgi:hypothetical protein